MWLGGAFYTAAILADYFDGFAARRTGRNTELGAHLDMEYDAAGVLFASIALVVHGVAGIWFLMVGLARYLFVAGMLLRTRLKLENVSLLGSMSGRTTTGLQMGFMSIALWPIVPIHYLRIAGFVFSTFFFASFLRDWFVVSKAIRVGEGLYLAVQSALSHLLPPLQLLLRAISIALFLPNAASLELPARIAAYILSMAIAAGVAGRAASLSLLLLTIFAAVTEIRAAALLEISMLLVIILGTGPFSLFQPERQIFEKR